MPTTDDGKAVTRYNRVAHGLRAEIIVLPGIEDEDEWIEFHDAVLANLSPVGMFESELASRAAELMWRLRRVGRAERTWIDVYSRPPEDEFSSSRADRIAFHLNRHLAPDGETARLIRYESHLSRQLNQLLNQLRITQDRRIDAAAIELESTGDTASGEKLPNELLPPAPDADSPVRDAHAPPPPESRSPARDRKLPNELPAVGNQNQGLPSTADQPNELRETVNLLDQLLAEPPEPQGRTRERTPFYPPSVLDSS